jgi:hypothetical protein
MADRGNLNDAASKAPHLNTRDSDGHSNRNGYRYAEDDGTEGASIHQGSSGYVLVGTASNRLCLKAADNNDEAGNRTSASEWQPESEQRLYGGWFGNSIASGPEMPAREIPLQPHYSG